MGSGSEVEGYFYADDVQVEYDATCSPRRVPAALRRVTGTLRDEFSSDYIYGGSYGSTRLER